MRRVYVNLVAFALVAATLIAWSTVNFLHLDAIERPFKVTAEFEESPGLRPGYEVTYLGYSVGRIGGVELEPGLSEVRLDIDRDVELPRDVVAAARRRSAIGEPYVDLAPAPGTDPDVGPRLGDGDRIVLADTSSPLLYGDLFRSLDNLVSTVDADALGTVLDETATALDGRGDDIRRIVVGAADLTQTLSDNGDEIEQLIDGVAEITDVLATNRDALGSGLDSLAGLTEALEEARPSIEVFVDELPSTIGLLNRIIDASDHAVICLFEGTASLDATLDQAALDSLTNLLQRSAAFADVIRLVQDPDDGVFRLMVSPSGGNPPTVEFPERRPVPAIPRLPECPDVGGNTADPSDAPIADEAAPGQGGARPAADREAGESTRASERDVELASGASGADAGESFVRRALSAALRVLPWAVGAGVLCWLLFGVWRRRRVQQ